MRFLNKILAIVVLYNQRIGDSQTFLSLDTELEKLNLKLDVILYDNSLKSQYDDENFIWNNFNVIYHHNPENPGVSKAYNFGASIALTLKKDWILLLDQDTYFKEGFLNEMYNSLNANSTVELFAPMLKLTNGAFFSPAIAKHKRGYPPKELNPGIKSLFKLSPVNSGILIKVSLFKKVNGYNEKIKLDFSDFQFIEKVRNISPDFYLMNAVALQDFSNDEKSLDKALTRFKQYLDDAYHADKPSFSDRVGFFYTVSRHALGLSIKLKNLDFISLYIRKYILR